MNGTDCNATTTHEHSMQSNAMADDDADDDDRRDDDYETPTYIIVLRFWFPISTRRGVFQHKYKLDTRS